MGFSSSPCCRSLFLCREFPLCVLSTDGHTQGILQESAEQIAIHQCLETWKVSTSWYAEMLCWGLKHVDTFKKTKGRNPSLSLKNKHFLAFNRPQTHQQELLAMKVNLANTHCGMLSLRLTFYHETFIMILRWKQQRSLSEHSTTAGATIHTRNSPPAQCCHVLVDDFVFFLLTEVEFSTGFNKKDVGGCVSWWSCWQTGLESIEKNFI